MCLFCGISGKTVPAEILSETDDLIVFKDIVPKARVHLLIVPKEHIASVTELEERHALLLGRLILQAKEEAERAGIAESGYKLIFNVGNDGGQAIPHIHLHLLGGERLRGVT